MPTTPKVDLSKVKKVDPLAAAILESVHETVSSGSPAAPVQEAQPAQDHQVSARTTVQKEYDPKTDMRLKPAPVYNGVSKETQFHVFYCTIPSCTHIMQEKDVDGKFTPVTRTLVIAGGKYITKDPVEIAAMQELISSHHPHFYIKPGEEIMTAEDLDPMADVKRQAVEDYKREQAILAAGKRDLGSSESGKLNPASTSDMVDGEGSNSQ